MSETTPNPMFSAEVAAVLNDPDALKTLFLVFEQQRKDQAAADKAEREEARRAFIAMTDEVKTAGLASVVDTLLTWKPVEASSKEGSAWVGSASGAMPLTIDGVDYSVTVTIKDVKASAARKA